MCIRDRVCVVTILRPYILLNKRILPELTDPELAVILRHEILHIKRKHHLLQRFYDLASVLHWCNPFVWISKNDFELICEMDCDRKVLKSCTELAPGDYTRTMLHLLEMSSGTGKMCIRDSSWDEVVGQASRIEAFRSFIDVEDPVFYQAGHMIQRVQEYCRKTNQPVPVSVGELSRCVYESLAMQYRKTFETLEHILGYRLEALRIVGGGCRNKMLNQFAANALKRPVYAGPVERYLIHI